MVGQDMEVVRLSTSTNRLTLRLETNLLESLKKEAQSKDLTLNAMINKILNRNISYDNNVNAVHCITMSHDLFHEIIKGISHNEIQEIGKHGPKIARKLFSISGIEYDLYHIIHNYFTILSKYCGWFEFSHKEQNGKYRLVFSTGKDPKWSIFVQSYVKSILDSLKITGINGLEYDGIIVFEFMHKSELPNIIV